MHIHYYVSLVTSPLSYDFIKTALKFQLCFSLVKMIYMCAVFNSAGFVDGKTSIFVFQFNSFCLNLLHVMYIGMYIYLCMYVYTHLSSFKLAYKSQVFLQLFLM